MKSLFFALNGIREALVTQWSMKVHMFFSIVVLAAGYFFKIETLEWFMIIFCIGLVLTTELMNTAIEYLVNLVSPSHHEKAGKIKDLAAASVLVSATTALTVGLIIFLPRIIFFFKYF